MKKRISSILIILLFAVCVYSGTDMASACPLPAEEQETGTIPLNSSNTLDRTQGRVEALLVRKGNENSETDYSASKRKNENRSSSGSGTVAAVSSGNNAALRTVSGIRHTYCFMPALIRGMLANIYFKSRL